MNPKIKLRPALLLFPSFSTTESTHYEAQTKSKPRKKKAGTRTRDPHRKTKQTNNKKAQLGPSRESREDRSHRAAHRREGYAPRHPQDNRKYSMAAGVRQPPRKLQSKQNATAQAENPSQNQTPKRPERTEPDAANKRPEGPSRLT